MLPFENMTQPDGNPAMLWPANAGLLSVAVIAMALPLAPLVGFADNVSEVLACVTVKVTGDDVLGLKLASP